MSASDSRNDSFEVDTNSPFYFNTSHWQAVDGMLEGVRERAGLMLLTGPAGSGKTMIMRAISEGLDEKTPGLFLQYASLNFREFINFLHTSLHVEDEILDAPNKAVALREFLYVQAKRDETGVVFIDEAHNLEPDVLKMLPKLARFDTLEDGRIVGLQFVLIASEEMRELMADSEFDEVRSKIAVDHTLRFFSREELKQFLNKRLAPIARMTDVPITDDGVEEMGRFTGGSPRLIGMICSHTMLFAAENPGRSIDAQMVQEAAEALMLSPVENAFAEQDKATVSTTGPFSEADLSGDAPTPFSDTETVYSSDETDSVLSSLQGDFKGGDADAVPSAGALTAEGDDSLYAKDHIALADDDDDIPVPKGVAKTFEDDSEFDHADFNQALNDDDDFDDDDEFDDFDEEDEDEELTVSGSRTNKPGIKKGGSSFLQRLGWGKKPAVDGLAKVRGAGRMKEKPVDEASPVRPSRGPKARVVGDREKKIKLAKIGVAVVAVLGIGAAAYKPVVSAVGGMASTAKHQIAGMMEAETPEAFDAAQRSFSEVPDADNDANGMAGTGDNVTISVDNSNTNASGGWGARVVVRTDPDEFENPGSAKAMPAAVSGLAEGALDLVDKVIGVGEKSVSNDKLGGVLNAAAGQVAQMRDRVVKNGMSDEQASSKATELVAEGDAYLQQKNYITPSGKNAYDAYREALSLEPDNQAAQAGITNLREHFAKKAEGARDARQWESANKFFETAIAISNLRPVN